MSTGEFIGKTLGKCRILGRLGHGKTSRIFRASYAPLGKEVAVKILKEDQKATAEIRQKFVNEARALAKLDHESIVKVFDVVEEKGNLFIIMELLEGKDLYEVLKEDGALEAEKAVKVVTEVAKALEAAHQAGIVHRDVKPANIMLVGRRGHAKLLDFGLATEGIKGGRAGTPHYMSPEQIQGRRVDEKSDIYALGATFFHLLTGKPPYAGKTAKEIMARHVEGKLRAPSRVVRGVSVPKALDPVVKRMMAPVPGYRYSARDLVKTLEGLNLSAGTRRHHAHAARAAARRQKSSTPMVLAAAGVVVVVVGLVIALLATSGSKKHTKSAGTEENQASVPAPSAHPPASAPSIRDRAERAKAREEKAQHMLEMARSFAADHYGQYDAIIAQYKKVSDEYGDLAAGQEAERRMKEAEASRDAAKIAAEKAERAKKKRAATASLEKTLDETRKKFDFRGMKKAISDYELEWGETKELTRQMNAAGFAAQLLDSIGQAINSNEKKYALDRFQKSASSSSIVTRFEGGRVVIKEGDIERHAAWSTFTPEQIERFMTIEMGTRDAWNWCLLNAFYLCIGNKKKAAEALDNARLRDRVDKVGEYEKRLGVR